MRRLATALIFALGSCATAHDELARQRLPTAAEVISYVERTWESDGWDDRFARYVSRPGETVTLIRAENVHCDYYYGSPDCSFDVTGRFASGGDVTQKLRSHFEWRGGRLVGVVLLIHIRHTSD